jgi:hypothetical protein
MIAASCLRRNFCEREPGNLDRDDISGPGSCKAVHICISQFLGRCVPKASKAALPQYRRNDTAILTRWLTINCLLRYGFTVNLRIS